ncbi:hypothetical protein JZ751_017304 [Albula glossodonta]|uniref:LIM zinc-binding domain-containing protein n=1 Tax=Albula glossodonta TaxID=121402 RepID=A0A8T2MTU4_9TELE|nr:hypothetical protein JZ751_017304 [Albula glossodonta]
MDRLSSKLLEKLKLTDSGSVKFTSSKRKGETVNINNNNSCSSGGVGAGPGITVLPPSGSGGEASVRGARGGNAGLPPPIPLVTTPSDGSTSSDSYPLAEPPRRRSPPRRVPGDLSEAPCLRAIFPGGQPEAGDSEGQAAAHRRYSLELQHLAHRRQLLSQSPLFTPAAGDRGVFLHDPERHKRLSLQEALFYKRHSSGGEPWDSRAPLFPPAPPPPGPALSPRSSLCLQEALLASPRSSFASSTASGGSSCSSTRTSGISLGFDSRHAQLQLPAPPPIGAGTGPGLAGAARTAGQGPPPLEMWRDYLDGGVVGGSGQDSRHSYPPALERPQPRGPGDRARYSDLPGAQYQEELTRLLLWEAGGQRDLKGLLGALEGLTLKEPLPGPAPSSATPQSKPPVEPVTTRESENRQEYFGTCVKCGKGVYGAESACQALDSLYHTRCFTCVSCGRTLRNRDFYNVSGAVYCKEDYLILQALGNSYHPGCFRCVVCSKALDGVPFTVDYLNNVYCVSDYNSRGGRGEPREGGISTGERGTEGGRDQHRGEGNRGREGSAQGRGEQREGGISTGERGTEGGRDQHRREGNRGRDQHRGEGNRGREGSAQGRGGN